MTLDQDMEETEDHPEDTEESPEDMTITEAEEVPEEVEMKPASPPRRMTRSSYKRALAEFLNEPDYYFEGMQSKPPPRTRTRKS